MSLIEDIEKFEPKDLVNSHFSICVAKRRSGKSVLVEDFIKKQFDSDALDVAILFTGTGAGFPMIKKQHRFNADQIDKLDDIVNNYQVMNDFNKISDQKDKFKIRTLVVLDDLALQYKSKIFSEKLCDIAVRGRHYSYKPLSLSFIVITQKICMIPCVCRTNADYIMFNNIASMRELEVVLDENFFLLDSSRDGKKKARNIYNELVTSQEYLFIICENYRSNIKSYRDYVKSYVANYNK